MRHALPLIDPEVRRELYAWYRGPLGRRVAEAEQAELDRVLPDIFGYHIVQVGAPAGRQRIDASRIPHRVVVDPDTANPAGVGLAALPEMLPFATDSVDALVLDHVLELSTHPHELLREVDRTLVPDGHVIIMGFNPYSLWGLWRMAVGWRRRVPWRGRFFSGGRLKDWLLLLGFEPVAVRGFFMRPPLRHEGALERLRFLERLQGRWCPLPPAIYVLIARKKVMAMTPLKPRWRPRKGVLAPAPVEPTPHRVRHGR
ncbi:MAG: class I SAM-dependent methyltransferase [Gammaproteobacteria bacterium]|nr:class I SAM-dependent methyltransferase [Gammaproteobacteria bacterium]